MSKEPDFEAGPPAEDWLRVVPEDRHLGAFEPEYISPGQAARLDQALAAELDKEADG